jgi:hypothetical protein
MALHPHLEKWANGDAGDALDWALDHLNDSYERTDFLECWREGDVSHWPEYAHWLSVQYRAERRSA